MRVLALSSSRVGEGAYLAAAVPMIDAFLGKEPLNIAFLPFAAVDGDYSAYASKVSEGLAALPHTINVVNANNASPLEQCDVIMVGGGNTFKLLHDIYAQGLFELVQKKVQASTPYIGWSAGSNLVGKTICTTNDMPVIQPESFTAFGFLPFQINPHYHNIAIKGFNGETRDQRLTEFLVLNPSVPVVGLPEGTALLLQDDTLALLGEKEGVLFRCKDNDSMPEKTSLTPGDDLSFLLR